METANLSLLERRRHGFDAFYKELLPCLVEFVGDMGIQPADMVLKQAATYAPVLEVALQNMLVANREERDWLCARMGYFIGEYCVQQFDGCWAVNDIPGSRYFARYVVGQFQAAKNLQMMLDPFEMAIEYVDAPIPRQLQTLLDAASIELIG